MPRGRTLAALAVLMLLVPQLAASMASEGTGNAQSDTQPNIVLIVLDDLDARSVEFMPNVTALLADQGVSFDNFVVTLPGCCPSRASILRGQYVHNHGVLRSYGEFGGFARFLELDHEQATVATWLQDAGYRTALIGKYLNGYPDGAEPTYIPPGWDEWYAAAKDDETGTRKRYFGQSLNENGEIVTYHHRPEYYSTDVYAAKATDFAQRAIGDGQPFFAYIAPAAPHRPATPAHRHEAAFADATAPRLPSFNPADVGDKPAWVRGSPALSTAELAEIDAEYRNRLRSLLAVDEMVAALVDTLRAADALEETYVFFTSDHGFHLGEHRLAMEKGTPYEESIRVPLIVRGPGIAAGRAEDRVASNADLAPTFAALAGATTPEFVDGRSLLPLFAGDLAAENWRQAVLVEYFVPRLAVRAGGGGDEEPTNETATGRLRPRQPAWRALRTSDRVYLEYATGERELYDLRADPYQLDNLAAEADPALLVRLSAQLAALTECAGTSCRAAEDGRFDGSDGPPPMPIIGEPNLDMLIEVGQELTLRGSAIDARGRTLPDSSLSWTVVLRDGDQAQPVLGPIPGNNVSVTAPPPASLAAAATSHLEVQLTATDGDGRRRMVSRALPPAGPALTFATEPAGLILRVDGRDIVGPTTLGSWTGFEFRIEAPTQVGPDGQEMEWVSWSDGGAAAHTIRAVKKKGEVTYTATFRPAAADAAADADFAVIDTAPIADVRRGA